MSPEAIGALLVGIAAIIGSSASAYMTVLNSRRIRDIDHAVNGRPEGAVTMQTQVADLHRDRPGEEAVGGVAMRQMVELLVRDMYDRREKEG